jgi:hypothetical protein
MVARPAVLRVISEFPAAFITAGDGFEWMAAIGVALTCTLGVEAAILAAESRIGAIVLNFAGAAVSHTDADGFAGGVVDRAGADARTRAELTAAFAARKQPVGAPRAGLAAATDAVSTASGATGAVVGTRFAGSPALDTFALCTCSATTLHIRGAGSTFFETPAPALLAAVTETAFAPTDAGLIIPATATVARRLAPLVVAAMTGATLHADLARRSPVAFARRADVVAGAEWRAAVAEIAAAVAEFVWSTILVAIAGGSAASSGNRAERRAVVKGGSAAAICQAEVVTLRYTSPRKHEVTRAAGAFALLVAGCPVAAVPLPFALFSRSAALRRCRMVESEGPARCTDDETGQNPHHLPA